MGDHVRHFLGAVGRSLDAGQSGDRLWAVMNRSFLGRNAARPVGRAALRALQRASTVSVPLMPGWSVQTNV